MWKQEGDDIILGLDCNDDVRKCKLVDLLLDINIVETVTEMHGLQGPATQQSNTIRKPIDGIWSSENCAPTRTGYLAFGEGII